MKVIVKDLEAHLRKKQECDKICVAYRLRKDGITIEISCPGCSSTRSCNDFFSKFGFTGEVNAK